MQAKAIPLEHYDDDLYPSSDGKPMAESDLHLEEMVYLIAALKDRYRNDPDTYVAGNLLFYYAQGDRKAVVSPDVFVVRGIPKGNRMSFKLWVEGRAPCFVIEVTSRSTRSEDLNDKRSLYERLGVEEYFLHDPGGAGGHYLSPALQGFRLLDGWYRPITPDSDGALVSRTTNLRLCREGEHLRLVDLDTREPLLSLQESQEANRRKDAALRDALTELARLRSELGSRGSR